MKLIRYAYPQTQASNAFNRLFDLGAPTIGRFGSLLDDLIGAEVEYEQPAVDLYEDEQNFYARFELPGLNRDQIDLELENSVLTIRRQEEKKEEASVMRSRHERSISVPDGVDLDHVSAEMKDGILTVTMPKVEACKPRQISVK